MNTNSMRNAKVAALSDGWRRILQIVLAFVGEPPVVILDEPTYGLDVFNRRRIWDFVAKRKQGRVVMISTHFMDEAEFLADTVGILRQGKLRCAGSISYLKTVFGCGYALKLTLHDTAVQRTMDRLKWVLQSKSGQLPTVGRMGEK